MIFGRALEYPMRTSAAMTARCVKVRRTNEVTRKITLLKRHYRAGTLSYLLWCREGCGQPSQWDRACLRLPTHLNKVQVHSPVIRGPERAARVIDLLFHSRQTLHEVTDGRAATFHIATTRIQAHRSATPFIHHPRRCLAVQYAHYVI
jgi:hypothetical protein